MKKIITNVRSIRYSITFYFNCFAMAFALLFVMQVNGQVPTWVNEGFGGSPYPASPNYFLSNAPTSWTEGEISGTVGYPDAWTYTIPGGVPATYKTTMGGFIQTASNITNHGQFAGAGFLQYNNRSINFPNTTNVAPAGDAAYIATRSLDFSGHSIYNAAADTFGFWFWRDNCTAGAVDTVSDSIVVYINTSPVLIGPDLVKLTEVNTASPFIPRSSTKLPLQGPVGPGWRRCSYTIPNTAAYIGGGATSTAYVIVVAYSRGGNNMFLDDFTLPEWQTPMVVQLATVYYQENADVDKGTNGNLIMGVKITTKGSSSPIKIDAATFSASGSTAYATDVQNPLVYYTGAAANFATTGGSVTMPYNATGPGAGLLNFGWYAVGCPALITPATVTLSPGTENYIWLTYDIKPTATVGDFVGADFQYITSKPGGTCTYIGSSISTVLPPPILPQTLGKARQIEATYPIPTYTGGLGVPGYFDFDCVSAVWLPGDNSTMIQNYYHDDSCGGCNSVHPVSDPQHIYCIRWACHPNDYTNFRPYNLGTFKNRGIVQVTTGKGVRTTTAPYQLRAQVGSVTNRIAVFIDWNKDGDFDDKYVGTTGIPAQDVAIFECIGGTTVTPLHTKTQGAGQLTQFPVSAWPANSLWTVDVPQTTDVVTDLNDPNQPPLNSTTPIAISNVRMRIRCCVNAVTIGPFTNGYTEGETEDYTIQVLDNCPVPGYNICKWIGTTNDWNTVSNWCPGIPTINDMAYIGIVNGNNFFYPTINANTPAVCRQLKLMDTGTGTGAKLTIDANTNSTLTVADDIIIGYGAPAGGTGASIAVRSDFSKLITIPGKTTVPPLGIALAPQTPFRTNAQGKTQISYTAAELGTTYGWRAGDIIDQISIEVNSITPSIGSSIYPNFRIQAFLTNTVVTYPFPPPLNTKIAVAAGDANVVAGWPKIIFPSTILNLNMPQATNGTQAGGNYYTFNLTANTMVWDGVSNLVLSFEYNTAVGASPLKNYVLYDESNSVFSVLSLNYNTAGSTITGYNIDGNGHYTGGAAAITAAVSNQRPRLDFNYHRPYQRFDITVGGKLINNNKFVRTLPFSTTPVYGIAGDSGFVASNSKVIFDPTTRSIVTTPGYPGNPGLTSVNSFNPIIQPKDFTSTGLTDIDQEITSTNNASTVFYGLEINKVSGTGKAVKQNSTTITLIGAYADSLILTNGELNLNRKEFTLTKPSASNLIRPINGGWIRSEDNTVPAGTIQSKFSWNIGTNTGIHDIPFGTASTNVFPFRINPTSGDVGKLTVGTYGTPQNNTAYPVSPTVVTAMTSMGTLAVDWTVDRFWYVKKSTVTPITGNMRFNYPVAEGTALAAYSAGNMKAQRWENLGVGWGWHPPYVGQSDGNPGPTFVDHDAAYVSDLFNMWTVVSLVNGQTPLPLQLVKFDVRQVDNKVKIWWDVQTERDVIKYNVERTTDQNHFNLLSSTASRGPSNGLLNYETFDFNPLKGWQYYRLATYNDNGTIDYSELKSVNIKNIFEIINVNAENSGSIKVDFSYDSQLPYTYTVTDIYGKTIAKGKDKASIGFNSIQIPVNLAKGIYFISLSNDEKVLTQKLVY
ncbi:MAG: GEVED domain-containing protein [Bacteroidia bacterium]